MAFWGQVLVNPVSGERFVFHTTAAESHGKLLEFDLVVEPHGRVPGGHVHPPIPRPPSAVPARRARDARPPADGRPARVRSGAP